jgi:hypothetical protein
VKYADGSPVVARYDNEGNPVYVYKFINLHGDGQYATEYYGDGRPSVFNNGSQKNVKNVEGTIVSNEIPDQAIIDLYGGESVPQDVADPIIATIEKETENVVPAQPIAVSGEREFTPEKLTKENMPTNGIFVFGSNTEGRHGAGAAKAAVDEFGAKYGQAEGLQGQSFAIVTKDLAKGNRSVSLEKIQSGFVNLLSEAGKNPDKKFYVTKLGTDLAGFTIEEIKGIIKKLDDAFGINDNIILPKEFEVRSTQPIVSETKQELKLPEYTVDKNLRNKDGSIRYAATDGGKITINPVSDANKFFDYFEGKEGGPTSAQKAQVLSELAKQGYTLDVIKSMLNTNKLINTFLILHEQSHIDNNDKDVYWLNSKDLLTPDRIAIEVRATVDALEKLGGKPLQKSTSEVRYKDKAKRIRVEYPKTIQALNSKLDSSKLVEVSKLTNYTNVFEGDIMNYSKEVGEVYGPQAERYAAFTSSEITNEEGEFFKNNPEFATELLEAFENDDLGDGKTLAEYAQILLNQNEKLVDTAQMSLFDPNNEDLEGADEPNPCGTI